MKIRELIAILDRREMGPSEVGAVCGKAARTVLCGGRPAMVVPTATVEA
jgi:hypothetical protein